MQTILTFRAPRFKGFQQQDSQELLRYLLDSVKTDQLKVGHNHTVLKIYYIVTAIRNTCVCDYVYC